MRRVASKKGFTIVELMVSTIILAIVTSIIAAYLVSSIRVNELNLARSDLRGNLTVAMELITSDLYSAGSIGVSTNTTELCDPQLVNDTTEPAFKLDSGDPLSHEFTVRYCDPYTRDAKRDSYKLDVSTGTGNLLNLKLEEATHDGSAWKSKGGFQPTIPGIIAVELDLQCKPNPTIVCDGCYKLKF